MPAESSKENIPTLRHSRSAYAMLPSVPSFANLAELGNGFGGSDADSGRSLGFGGMASTKSVPVFGQPVAHGPIFRSKTSPPLAVPGVTGYASSESTPAINGGLTISDPLHHQNQHLHNVQLQQAGSSGSSQRRRIANHAQGAGGPTLPLHTQHHPQRHHPYSRSVLGNQSSFAAGQHAASSSASNLAFPMGNGNSLSVRNSPSIRHHMELLRIAPHGKSVVDLGSSSMAAIPMQQIRVSQAATIEYHSNKHQAQHQQQQQQPHIHRAVEYMESSDLLSDPPNHFARSHHASSAAQQLLSDSNNANQLDQPGLVSPPETSSPDAMVRRSSRARLQGMRQTLADGGRRSVSENMGRAAQGGHAEEIDDSVQPLGLMEDDDDAEDDEDEWTPSRHASSRISKLEQMVKAKRGERKLQLESEEREEKERMLALELATYGPAVLPSPKLLEAEAGDIWAEDVFHLERCVWEWSLEREKHYAANPEYFARHCGVEPHVRATVIDWMTEVCEEYFLHRETLHLAAAYFDRFMTEARGIKRTQVQLVGVTALFVAAKLEEIYPPRVGEFAKVCDGACTIDDILGLEVHMLDTLRWQLNPPTVNLWMNLYFNNAVRLSQKRYSEFPSMPSTAPPARPGLRPRNSGSGASAGAASGVTGDCSAVPRWARMRNFPGPRFKKKDFKACMSLADAALVDEESLKFRPSAIAAAALHVMHSPKEKAAEFVQDLTGYTSQQLQPVLKWMEDFKAWPQVGRRDKFPNIHESDMHNIQTHNKALLEMYRRAATDRLRRVRPSSS